jgi:uncharacterized membrane protein YbhN (UPF0104 family)/tRNA A-37 threonylcarbamoyl transferase component Bud32
VTSTDHAAQRPATSTAARQRSRIGRRAARWRLGSFGPASEEPYRRRVIDRVRLAVAAVLLAGLVVHSNYPSAVERDVFRLINDLPGAWSSTFNSLYAVGTLWAVGLAVAAAVVGRRWRLARDLLIAGVAAWGTAHAIGAWVAGEGLSASFKAITRVGVSPLFPQPRLAIVFAVAATASPYLTRPTRRIGQLVAVGVAVSALYLGTGLPNDVLGGLVLGWGIAAVVHLVFGSPGGRPTSAQVTAALAELGVYARGIHLARKQPRGSTLMLGRDERGPIAVRVIGRDEADAQLLAKLWRFTAYKDPGPTLYLTRLQQVEHEAYVTLLARDAGVRTSDVVVAGQAGPRTAVLVTRPASGTPLAEMRHGDVSDAALADLWRQVGRLHRQARVAHGALDAHHVVVDTQKPAIIDFDYATTLSPVRASTDIADLLVSTAVIVGEERATAAAAQGIGPDALAQALPFMQPAALSPGARSAGGRTRVKARMDKLRSLGAKAAGVDPPQVQELHRVSPANLLLAVGTLVGVSALLSGVGSPAHLWSTVNAADWTWALIALALSLATNVTFALGLMGTVPVKLPLGVTTEVQVSMSFANLAIPAVGGTTSQIRFLQKEGVDLASAVAAGGLLSNVANVVVSVAVLAVAIAASPDHFKTASIPVAGVVRVLLVLVVVSGLAVVAVRGIPRLRLLVMPPVKQAMATIGAALRSRRQLSYLVLGPVGTNVLYAFCLLGCLKAFGATLSVWTLLAVSIAISTLASLVPIPGGGTALGSVGMSGALTGFGVPTEAAVAAVLLNQVVVNYLPAIPGWFATEHLMRRDYL